MPDPQADSSAGAGQQIPVSPNNPCPFLRGLVAGGYVGGHIVPLPKLTGTIEAATDEKGLKERIAGMEIYLVALIANGLSPLRLLKLVVGCRTRRTAQRPARQARRRLAHPGRRRARA